MSDRSEVASERESERVGLVVAERYTLIRRLGRGGMGTVWAANDELTSTEVALKLVTMKRHRSPELLSRFAREADAIAEVESRHVVKVLDHGLDERTGPYIALELLEGEDLGKRLDREGTLPLRDVVQIIVQACRGLAKAHEVGIVHRDMKPENIYLEELRGRMFVKIVDFGVAKVVDDGGRALTAPGELLGTLEYMSPEHVLGRGPLDARADLYSLGVVAYRSLVGRPPFESDQIGELILKLTTTHAVPPSTMRNDVPPHVDRWFDRALAREPADRFQTAFEMADALVAAWRASSAKIEDFDAPLSLSPASMAKMRATPPPSEPPPDSDPAPSLELADVVLRPRGSASSSARHSPADLRTTGSLAPSQRPERSVSQQAPVVVPSQRPEAAPSTLRPGARTGPVPPRPAVRTASQPPRSEAEPGLAWLTGEGKMFALVASVLVVVSLVFYALAS